MLNDRVLPINDKCKKAIANRGFLNVFEGSVRSGKTVDGLISFGLDLAQSPEKKHLMLGQTLGGVLSNLVTEEFGFLDLFKGAVLKKNSANLHIIHFAGKHIYCLVS